MPTKFVGTGTSPESVTVDPSGKYVYVANFGDGNISQYTIGATGSLNPGSLTPLPPATVSAYPGPFSITLSQGTALVSSVPKYAYAANAGGGVSQYTIGADGSLAPIGTGTVSAGSNPNSVTVDPSGQFAYVANYGGDNVSQYTIGADGSLAPIGTGTVSAGSAPSSVTVDPSGRYVYVANYGDNTISQYTIGADGSLAPIGTGTVSASTAPFSVTVDPSGRYAYVANFGDGTVSQYTIGADGSLAPIGTGTVSAGSAPSSVTVDPSGRYVYVANNANNNVSQFTIGTDGSLTAMTTATVSAGTAPNSVTVDPSGKFAYVANYDVANSGSSTVSQYTIGADGSLTPIGTGTVLAGANPSSVTIDPSSKYAYVANYDVANSGSSTVSQYTIGADGSLTPIGTGTVLAGTNPSSIVTIGTWQ
jgi:6-phosphogluconolactonase (cycloisomerase 2 family)